MLHLSVAHFSFHNGNNNTWNITIRCNVSKTCFMWYKLVNEWMMLMSTKCKCKCGRQTPRVLHQPSQGWAWFRTWRGYSELQGGSLRSAASSRALVNEVSPSIGFWRRPTISNGRKRPRRHLTRSSNSWWRPWSWSLRPTGNRFYSTLRPPHNWLAPPWW